MVALRSHGSCAMHCYVVGKLALGIVLDGSVILRELCDLDTDVGFHPLDTKSCGHALRRVCCQDGDR